MVQLASIARVAIAFCFAVLGRDMPVNRPLTFCMKGYEPIATDDVFTWDVRKIIVDLLAPFFISFRCGQMFSLLSRGGRGGSNSRIVRAAQR